MSNKRPAEQWYSGDWYRAVDIQKCCPATRGIWRDALDAMVNEQITGKIRGTRKELTRLLRCNDVELQCFFDDNKEHKFANVTFRNKKVTIICRRLYRVYLEREGTKKRVQKHRQQTKRDCNADVTPYSSTSSSSSKEKEKYKKEKGEKFIPPTLEEINTYCIEKGIDVVPDYIWNFYEKKDWMVGRSKMKKWTAAVSGAKYWTDAPRRKLPAKPDPVAEDAAEEKRRQEIRDDDGQFFREQTTEKLIGFLKAKPMIKRWWLIKEILAERGE